MSRAFELRAEDVLTIIVAALLVVTGAGVAGPGEAEWWEYSFIVFPATLMILGVAIRYAFGASGAGASIRRVGSIVRDWLPFALFLMFYETLRSHLWTGLSGRERDAALLAIDRRLLGETPAVSMQAFISPIVTQILAVCYFAHLLLPPILALLWYTRDLRVFREFLLAVFVCGAIGSACYIAVPAVGPAVAFPGLFQVPLHGDGAMQAVAMMDDIGRAPHDVFPSLHIAISAIVLLFAARHGRRTFWLVLPLITGNWIATMYLRYHYAIDVIAGFVLAPLCVLIARGLLAAEARWYRRPAGDGTPAAL